MNILPYLVVGIYILHVVLIWQGKITFDTKNNKVDRFAICFIMFSFVSGMAS